MSNCYGDCDLGQVVQAVRRADGINKTALGRDIVKIFVSHYPLVLVQIPGWTAPGINLQVTACEPC